MLGLSTGLFSFMACFPLTQWVSPRETLRTFLLYLALKIHFVALKICLKTAHIHFYFFLGLERAIIALLIDKVCANVVFF